MKTEQQIITQKANLENQLIKLRAYIQPMDHATTEVKSLYGYAKCIESGKEALDWVLSEDATDELVY